ncbi:hypothetical protein Pfo_025843, partial [Paulownia fortunei]
MNTKSEKVLDNGRSVVVNLKRKQSDRGTISSKGAVCVLLPQRSSPSLSIHNLAKRRKLDGFKNKYGSCAFPSGKCLLKYYSNFKKSGILHRLMYYYNDEWNDFSQDIVTNVNKDFVVKKPAVEVEVNGNKILLDFLWMMQLDMNTGLHQPIAWIDVSGKCFFPDIFIDYDEPHLGAEGHDHPGAEPPVHGLDDESSGESFPLVEQVEAHENAALEDCGDEINKCAKASDVEADENRGDNQQMKGSTVLAVDPIHGSLHSHAVRELFFRAISSCAAKIVEIRPCTSIVMESRLELFKKQLEITKRYRGDANVQYAWLPCSGGTVSAILKYGVSHYEPLKINPSHGNGIHLIPANGTPISVNYFGVDENDTRHMVLCRVIMGNMELVPCGSNQFLSSSEDFDSGVDRLQNPNLYIIWNMNVNSHIYSECVVSFKMTSHVEEPVFGKESKVDIPGVNTCYEGPQTQVLSETIQARTPKSPWMSFPMLIVAISNKVTSPCVDLVNSNYSLFKNKKINRDAFVKILRLTVGDDLLKNPLPFDYVITIKRTISYPTALDCADLFFPLNIKGFGIITKFYNISINPKVIIS